MVTIDLLPEKAKVADVIRLYVLGGVALYLLAGGAFFGMRMSALGELNELKNQTAEVEKKLEALGSIQSEVAKLAKNKSTLEKDAEVLTTLRLRQSIWVNVLDLIPDVMPASATLTEIKNAGGKGKASSKDSTMVTLKVFGLDREVIPALYTALEGRQEIGTVTVDKVQNNVSTVGGKQGFSFEVTFEYQGSGG